MIQVFRPKYDVEACLKNIREVLESGWTGQGPKCQAFEAAWKDFTGAQHAHYVNSATAGLHLAVRLLDLPKGSRVATTPITFCSTNNVLLYEGLEPYFCDVNSRTMSLNAHMVIDACMHQDAKAVVWVHYAGEVTDDFYVFMEWRKNHQPDLMVIEDCAHAAGAFYADGSRVGSKDWSIAVFSYQAVKNLPTCDSGMICCPTEEMDKRARKLSWMGISKSTFDRSGTQAGTELYKWRYEVDECGWKYNGNDIAASIALAQIPLLDRDNAYRRQLYNWYAEEFMLDGNVYLIRHRKESSVHLCAVILKNRDQVMAEMRLKGIAPGMHYLPNNAFPVFKPYGGETVVAATVSEQLLTLPTHLMLTRKDIANIAGVVKAAAVV